MHPELAPTGIMLTEQVGYVVNGMQQTKETCVSDTAYHSQSVKEPLPVDDGSKF